MRNRTKLCCALLSFGFFFDCCKLITSTKGIFVFIDIGNSYDLELSYAFVDFISKSLE